MKTRKENDVVFSKVHDARQVQPDWRRTAIAYEPKEPSKHSFFVG